MRYKNQNIAVLGAGLSGSAAALLLRSEGAHVTMLDSAEEKNLLKSTIDNLRAQDVRVICGAAADEDSSTYQMAVLSPGIDPASPAGAQFLVARNRHHRRTRIGLAILRNSGDRSHWHERQNDNDRIASSDVECLRPADNCLRQYRQTAFRSGARETADSTCSLWR